jgi:hypothetical protein
MWKQVPKRRELPAIVKLASQLKAFCPCYQLLSTSFYSSSESKAIFQVDKNSYQRRIQCAIKFHIKQAFMPVNQMPIKIKN